MKIAILGWGSLIWQPNELEFNKDFNWKKNGPFLPIEFARISKDGRLTLVITEQGTLVPVLFTISNYKNLDEAILNLAVREGSGRKSIGSYDKNKDKFSDNFFYNKNIRTWIKNTDFDAVIWTSLIENWTSKTTDRIKYLRELNSITAILSEEYIRKAPKQIKTTLRKELEVTLKWTPII